MHLSVYLTFLISAVVCLAGSTPGRETNAQRFARGLPPMSPARFHRASGVLGEYIQIDSLTWPTLTHCSSRLQMPVTPNRPAQLRLARNLLPVAWNSENAVPSTSMGRKKSANWRHKQDSNPGRWIRPTIANGLPTKRAIGA